MKLSMIPTAEKSKKVSVLLRETTYKRLEAYVEMCSEHTGTTVRMAPVVEQMLLDFMASDKKFMARQNPRKPVKPKTEKPDSGGAPLVSSSSPHSSSSAV